MRGRWRRGDQGGSCRGAVAHVDHTSRVAGVGQTEQNGTCLFCADGCPRGGDDVELGFLPRQMRGQVGVARVLHPVPRAQVCTGSVADVIASLRWHDPEQVYRSEAWPPSQPLSGAPVLCATLLHAGAAGAAVATGGRQPPPSWQRAARTMHTKPRQVLLGPTQVHARSHRVQAVSRSHCKPVSTTPRRGPRTHVMMFVTYRTVTGPDASRMRPRTTAPTRVAAHTGRVRGLTRSHTPSMRPCLWVPPLFINLLVNSAGHPTCRVQ